MPKFMVYERDNYEPEDAKEVEAWDAETAAEMFTETNHSDWEYPENSYIIVKDAEGNVSTFCVEARTEYAFYTTLMKPKNRWDP